VFNIEGAESTNPLIAAATKAVFAICELSVPCGAVGAVGIPFRSTDGMIELDRNCIKGMFYPRKSFYRN
jgi:hypothetical protein